MEEDFNLHVKMDGIEEAEARLRQLARSVGDSAPISPGGAATSDAQPPASDALHPQRPDLDVSAARNVADASKRVVEAFAAIGENGKRFSSVLANLGTVFRGTNFARALGIKPDTPAAGGGTEMSESFARTFSRIVGSRVLMGPANVGFEYAKNPLHDNFEINRAQRTTNAAVTTLAATGSPLAAAIAGLTSFLQSNVEKRNQLHVQEYGVQQRLLDDQRQVQERGGDWAFNAIQNMLSRPEQIHNLRLRANQIRGVASIEESYMPESLREALEEDKKQSETDEKSEKPAVKEVETPIARAGDIVAKPPEKVETPVARAGDIVAQPPVKPETPIAYASAAEVDAQAEAREPVTPAEAVSAAVATEAERVATNYKIRLMMVNPLEGFYPPLSLPMESAKESEASAALELLKPEPEKERYVPTLIKQYEAIAGDVAAKPEYANVGSKRLSEYFGVANLQQYSSLKDELARVVGRPGLPASDADITVSAAEWALEHQRLSPAAALAARDISHYARTPQNEAIEAAQRKFIEDTVKNLKANPAELEAIDVSSLEWLRQYVPDNEKDSEWFKKVNGMYTSQSRRAAELDLEADKLELDPSQIMRQYTEASRVTDTMARQGFFIGSQVDVQDVNRDILAEVRKIIPKLDVFAKQQVSYSPGGFLAKSDFE